MDITRRDFSKLALAALPAATLAAKLNSDFNGVQIGVIAPYSYRAMPDANNAEAILKHLLTNGLSAAELSPEPIEAWAGAPPPAPAPQAAARGQGPTPEQLEAAAALKKWRLSASFDKARALRKLYNDAGVKIYEVRILPDMTMSDDEYDYAFTLANAMGANQIGGELPTDLSHTKRLGDFALKHKMIVAYHAHTQATLTAWDAALAQSKGNFAQLDCGHYVAGTGLSPIPVIEKLHDRMANVHLKDRTTPEHGAKNLPWGTGDTPLADILRLMRDKKYKFTAAIELEYPVPQDSDSVTEVGKCVHFCRKALA
jgi:sugar phosphate isomerase/epimerase